MILIDNLIKEEQNQSEVTVTIDNVEYKGWQISKPLNYTSEYFSLSERWKMVKLIMEGKAIAVQFFEDLTEEQQINFVKNKLK